MSQLLRHVPDEYRGRVFATMESMVWSTMMVSMMLAGIASQYWDPRVIGAVGRRPQLHDRDLLGVGELDRAAAGAGRRRRRRRRGGSAWRAHRLRLGRRQGWCWLPARQSGSGAASRCGWPRRARGWPSTTTAPKPRRAHTAEECGGAPLFRANLESVAEIERLFAEVEERCGRLDGLVNNAARFTRRDPIEITEADWDFIHSVNLKAVFFCCQQARGSCGETGGGRIVNISSLGGIRPWAEHAHYCASKAGVIMLTRALAKAFAPEITVNSVAPGVIPFDDIDARGLKMIEATPGAARRYPGGGGRCGGLFPEGIELHHRAGAGGGRRPEPAIGMRPACKNRGAVHCLRKNCARLWKSDASGLIPRDLAVHRIIPAPARFCRT